MSVNAFKILKYLCVYKRDICSEFATFTFKIIDEISYSFTGNTFVFIKIQDLVMTVSFFIIIFLTNIFMFSNLKTNLIILNRGIRLNAC